MLLDLDQFKEINDALGHLAGDALLREVAKRLTSVARASDTWARLGGDEFALVQEDLQSPEGVAAMASRVLAALEPPFHLDGREVDMAGSIGVTVYPADGDSPERLIRNADLALYRAKAAGRGKFEPYRSELDREMRRGKVQRELRRALEQDGLDLVYQPVFELPRQRLVKTEALLRGSAGKTAATCLRPYSSRRPRAPGLIHPLGEWVLRRACRQGAAWLAMGQP